MIVGQCLSGTWVSENFEDQPLPVEAGCGCRCAAPASSCPCCHLFLHSVCSLVHLVSSVKKLCFMVYLKSFCPCSEYLGSPEMLQSLIALVSKYCGSSLCPSKDRYVNIT